MPDRKQKADTPGRGAAKALTARIRNARAIVATDRGEPRGGAAPAQIAQLQRHMASLQGLVLAQARLLALLTDPTPGDLIDDGG